MPIPVDGADDVFRVATLDIEAATESGSGVGAVTHHVLDA